MIQTIRRWFAFPLLAKDLMERAARPRTYLLRLIFGCLFIGIFWLYYESRYVGRYHGGSALYALLGTGAATFQTLAMLLTGATILFQPALMAGVLTHEKERETLALLLLADIGPWRLLIQKFIGGLLPMFTLLLFGLPLGAISYAYGGVSVEKMAGTAFVIGATWLQIGSLALLCSAWFRTTTSATVAAYVAAAILIFGTDYALWVWQDGKPATLLGRAFQNREVEQLRLSPVIVLNQVTAITSIRWPLSSRLCWNATAPMLASAGLFFILARLCLLRRALIPPSTSTRNLFGWLDATFEKLNSYLGGTAYRGGREHSLPTDQPILWRETSRGILGRPQHLVRLALGLLIAVCGALVLLLIVNPFHRFPSNLTFMSEALIIVGVLAVAACACDAIGRERTHQTLDVLLTTPIEPLQIVKEKLSSARRLGGIFIANIAVLVSLKLALFLYMPDEDWLDARSADATAFGPDYKWFFVTCIVVGLPLMFAVVRWFAVSVSIRIRNRSRALLTCLGILALWCGAPIIVKIFAPDFKQTQRWADAVSPFGILAHAEAGTFFKLSTVRPTKKTEQRIATINRALMVLAIQCSFLLFFRTLSLRSAEKHLRPN